MASIKEKDLSTAVGVVSTDYLRIVDASGTSKKAPASVITSMEQDVDDLKDLIAKTTESTGSFSVSANAASIQTVALTPPDSDYTALTIADMQVTASAAIPISWGISGTNEARVTVRNITGSSVTQTVTFVVLWKRTIT